jgi:hypothetical protein
MRFHSTGPDSIDSGKMHRDQNLFFSLQNHCKEITDFQLCCHKAIFVGLYSIMFNNRETCH